MTQTNLIQSDDIVRSEKDSVISPSFRWIIIIIAALLTGLAWRIRGDGNFGSFWGMLVPATLLTLLIYYAFPDQHQLKLTSATIGVSILLMAITVGGWGTIVGQITGRFAMTARPGVAGYDIFINPLYGFLAMFLIGFGWVPIWAFMIGRYFSNRKYIIEEMILVIVIFLFTKLIGELFYAHFLVPILAPECTQVFVDALGGVSPWEAFITHFKDEDYLVSIAGGRNYSSMLSNTSASVGSLVVWAYLRFILKDKHAAKIMISICVIFGISITVADLWQLWGREEFHWFGTLYTWTAPEWVAGQAWSLWEYFTGFLAGGVTVWLLLRMNKLNKKNKINQTSPRNEEERDLLFLGKLEALGKVGITWFFICGIAPLHGLAASMEEQYEGSSIYLYAIGFLVLLIIAILVKKRKINLPNWTLQKYSFMGTIIFTCIYVAIYMTSGYFDISRPANILVVFSIICGLALLIGCNAKSKYLCKEHQ